MKDYTVRVSLSWDTVFNEGISKGEIEREVYDYFKEKGTIDGFVEVEDILIDPIE